ncbi:MAG: hypothetical protein H6861_08245 [Rhodospirillales bacterium]|nr:hypothetical protein [Rhodospirillales bacterium]
MSDPRAGFLPKTLEYTPTAYVRDKAPLVCLVLYINLEFDDENHRVEQVNSIFQNYRYDDYMAQLIEVLQSDKDAHACYEAAVQAVQDGLIEKFDPDFDTDSFADKEPNIEKFYTVSFLEWAQQAGYKLPEYVMPDIEKKLDLYVRDKYHRDEDRQNFVRITKEDFEQRMNEPLWFMTDALLYLLGYKNNQAEDKKISFLRFNKRVEKIRQYILDAMKTEELKLYGYSDVCIKTEAGDMKNESETAFFASKVRPKDFVAWAENLPMTIPMLETRNSKTPTPLKPLSDRERSSLLKMIIGMAVKGYQYDPKAKRSPTAGEIVSDLQLLGISLDEDTARKWLKEAAHQFPPDLDRES